MNVQQALSQMLEIPADHVLEPGPYPAPPGLYAVVSEPADAGGPTYHATLTGHVPQRRTLTLLVTLYGQEGWALADLRPHYERLRHALPGLITEHPALPPLSRVTRGAAQPPAPDQGRRRPYAGVRLLLTYVE